MSLKIELQKAVRERGQIRRLFTRHAAQVEEKLQEKTYKDFNADYEYLAEKFQQLSTLDKVIQASYLSAEDENYVESAYEDEMEKCEEYTVRWFRIKADLSKHIDREANGPSNKPEQMQQSNMVLPKLEIRKFDDNPKNWIAFWAQFKKIHGNEGLDKEDKFQYLIQSMEVGTKARNLVESYPPTEENYPKVIQTLKDRFAKDSTLIEIYVRELLKLVNSKSKSSLETLYDKIVTNLQILGSLGVEKGKYECILLPMIESSLPESTLLLWSKVPYAGDESRLSNLLSFMQTEVEAERRVQLAKTEFLGNSKELVPTAACLVAESKHQVKESNVGQSGTEGKENCYFCEKPHSTFECNKASTLNLEEKKDAIKKKGGCYICLKRGHLAKYCKAFIKCMCCSRRHLMILCPTVHEQPKETASNLSSNNTTTLLQTLIVKVTGNNQTRKVRALLDSGSQRTYVRTALAEELGLQTTGSENLSHSLFGGVKKATQAHRIFEFTVSNLDDTYITTMKGVEQQKLCGNLPKVSDVHLIQNLQKHQIRLTDADKSVATLKEIDILIGSDYLGSILDNSLVHVTDKLVAVKTKLGWTLQGPIQSSHGLCNNVVHTNFVTTIPEMDNSLEFLWNIETLGIKDPYMEKENDIALEISVNDSGRYEVPMLWKYGYPKIESNFEAARKRLESTTKKLSATRKLEDYHNIFKEWEKEGIIEPVEDNRKDGHYLPHHAVIKLENTTTKIRPVFDASSKDKNGLALNMCIEKGANLIEVIPKLIILFRAGAYGVISDIKKAFLQVAVTPEDRKFLKLLWWNDPKVKNEVITYQHARVPFGIACSPFLLAKTINHHLEQNAHTYPETAARLKECFYVDNCVTSFDTKAEVKKFIKEATELMKKGKFDLRGWMTNSVEEEELLSVLGVQWDRTRDDLRCNLNLKTVPEKITKRDLLSITQQIFDPIGFLCPVTVVPKLIIQKAWLSKTGWDEEIPKELEKEYKDWIHTIDYLRECSIPRRITEFRLYESETTIHVFSDASKDAYSGCIFLRTEHEGQVNVRLVIAKSRVAPIKRQMTLPRLELMGALIASRLYKEVITSGLLAACKNYKLYCWTDSAVVLAWLQRQDTWKAFVTNRVKEICTVIDKHNWNHLPGIHNPADLPSRGCNSKTLLETRWWTGPRWLYLKEEKWPKTVIKNYNGKEEESINCEQSKSAAVHLQLTTDSFSSNLLHFSKYSKIIRLVARILRLSPTSRKKFNIKSKHIGFQEYKHAEGRLIKLIQEENYADTKNIGNKLIITEEDGFIKVKTRLEYSAEEKDFINPILLPGNNEIVQRMVQELHKKMNHAGTQSLMTSLRNSYWITSVRKLVKNTVSKCITCKREKAKHYVVPEPPLPADRIKATAPFEVTGIDLAGPLILKNNEKCWIVLFTCAVYRAVHLELVESLSTNSFLMTLRRFVARRGRPKTIYTDNGTNFVGAVNLLQKVNWQEIEEDTNSDGIEWKFSVPAAPWWGGWWERLIRVVKDMLRRILGKASIDWVELSTILCDCETVINSRPLTYVEMGDIKPLTPILFLQSIPTGETPDLDQIDEENVQTRYRYLQELRLQFRRRFKSEYLSLLTSKGKQDRKEPKVGDVVLVETEGKKRLYWPLGLIQEVYTGKDGFTRAARVRTATGEKVRPYQRLYPLELSTASQDWLDSIPAPSLADSQTGNSQSCVAPVPLAASSERYSRLGRVIKLPLRFME